MRKFLLSVLIIGFFGVLIVSASRIPVVGDDGDTWGTVLNNYLFTEHTDNGTHANITAETLNVSGDAVVGGLINQVNISNIVDTNTGTAILYGEGINNTGTTVNQTVAEIIANFTEIGNRVVVGCENITSATSNLCTLVDTNTQVSTLPFNTISGSILLNEENITDLAHIVANDDYNQSLNTTDAVLFDSINSSYLNTTVNATIYNLTVIANATVNTIIASNYLAPEGTKGFTLTEASDDLIMTADVGGSNYFGLHTTGAFIQLYANPGPAVDDLMFTISETQGADTEMNFYEGGTGNNRFWSSGSVRVGGAKNSLCSELTGDVDCDTPLTGADLVVEDDIWSGGKIFSSDWTDVSITESQISDLTTHNDDFNQTLNTSSHVGFGTVNATSFNGTLDCTLIAGGSDGDYCSDATGAGGGSDFQANQSLNTSDNVEFNNVDAGGAITSTDWTDVSITESQISDLTAHTVANDDYNQSLNTTDNVLFNQIAGNGSALTGIPIYITCGENAVLDTGQAEWSCGGNGEVGQYVHLWEDTTLTGIALSCTTGTGTATINVQISGSGSTTCTLTSTGTLDATACSDEIAAGDWVRPFTTTDSGHSNCVVTMKFETR